VTASQYVSGCGCGINLDDKERRTQRQLRILGLSLRRVRALDRIPPPLANFVAKLKFTGHQRSFRVFITVLRPLQLRTSITPLGDFRALRQIHLRPDKPPAVGVRVAQSEQRRAAAVDEGAHGAGLGQADEVVARVVAGCAAPGERCGGGEPEEGEEREGEHCCDCGDVQMRRIR
jgi:hypothetical protein